MQNRRNFYRILHVQPDAPVEIIRTSYRTLIQRLKMHPDLGGDHARATLINEAFATLRDREKRAAYDRKLAESRESRPGVRPETERARSRGGGTGPPESATKPAPTSPAPAKRSAVHRTTACAFCGESHSAQDANRPPAVCWQCESPLFPAVKLRDATSSGRALDRIPRSIAVDIRLAGSALHAFAAAIEDISISGARFTSAVELRAGQRLRLDCAFCIAVGVVRHAETEKNGRQLGWRIGVEFITLLVKQSRGAFVSTQV